MKNPITSVCDFIGYWYFRYLMVTELYMVEKWERIVCNVTIVVVLSLLSFINYKILLFTGALWSSPVRNATS